MKNGICKTVLVFTAVAMAILGLTVAPANAATMSASPTAPDIGGLDIASYGTPTGQDKWWPGPVDVYGTPGMTIGQTFTTGGENVMLNAFTFQVRDATEPTKEYVIRVGEVSGTTFTQIASEPVTQSFSTTADNYWTWTLDTPVLLSANTAYGVDVGLISSTSEWTTGIPYVYYTADVYPDGSKFRSGTAGYGVGDDTMEQMSGERVFHIDMESADPSLPDVDAGIDMITWSGQPVQLDPTVVNNDPNEPQGTLSYLWTADPADGVVFNPAAGDPNTSAAEAPEVTITKTTANPSPVKLTLAVALGGGGPMSDSMMIDVYDDSCLAAISIDTVELDPTDFDENCITNLADFVVLAADWLVDYEITEPVEKP